MSVYGNNREMNRSVCEVCRHAWCFWYVKCLQVNLSLAANYVWSWWQFGCSAFLRSISRTGGRALVELYLAVTTERWPGRPAKPYSSCGFPPWSSCDLSGWLQDFIAWDSIVWFARLALMDCLEGYVGNTFPCHRCALQLGQLRPWAVPAAIWALWGFVDHLHGMLTLSRMPACCQERLSPMVSSGRLCWRNWCSAGVKPNPCSNCCIPWNQ